MHKSNDLPFSSIQSPSNMTSLPLNPDKSQLHPSDLVDSTRLSHVRINATGTRLIYSSVPRGKKGDHVKSTLWIADVGKKHSARQLTSGSFNDHDPEFSPDGTKIAFVSDRADAGKTSAIYILHVDGGEAYPVTPADHKRGISSFAWSPSGKFIAFTSADEQTSEDKKKKEEDKDDVEVYGEDVLYDRLRLLNVDTRDVKVLFSSDSHVDGFGWSPDSKQIVFNTTLMPDEHYPDDSYIKILGVGDKTISSTLKFDGFISSAPVWASNGIFFLAGVTPRAIASSSSVYKATFDAEASSASRFEFGIDRCATELRLCNHQPIAYVQHGLSEELWLITDDEVEEIWSVDNALDDFDVVEVKDSLINTIIQNSVGKPPEVFTTTYDTRETVQVSNNNAALLQHDYGTSRAIDITSYDGKAKLQGYFVSPPGSKGPVPTYVCIHGGPYSRSTDAFDGSYYGWTSYLANTGGYGILVPNYRGNSSQGEEYAKYARGFAGTVDYDDIINMVQHGIDEGLIDPEKIVVGGWSQGGFLSYLCAVRNGEKLANGKERSWRFKAAICGAGVT
jgi:dipeptidyl aminopeptidase/acylaminoacyl peptidase